jgi:ribosomal protein S3
MTTYGILGIKVWVNKGEVIREINRQEAKSLKKTIVDGDKK